MLTVFMPTKESIKTVGMEMIFLEKRALYLVFAVP